ncbi:hypothetical protein Pint_35699 [Pistacia integerrima]|uniref:Uncharacterized protein n=1 Tax=Pistacia integerrima TaxID=434235 RepID=A0ACC0Y236_9ROSI|nr:hypothetical protein Pint_35699 [Pistacia integerrima]
MASDKKRISIIGGKELDLHWLFVEVTSRGGIKKGRFVPTMTAPSSRDRFATSLRNASSSMTSSSQRSSKSVMQRLFCVQQLTILFQIHR